MTTQYTEMPTAKGLYPGAQIGTYRVLKKIGAGGMGEVWLAEHTMLGRRAAIKVLHPEFSAREEIVTRFFNEARAATAINDPGIVQIFDFGKHHDGSAFIVMELLDGETLDSRCRTKGLTVTDALRIMRQVAKSLGAAHANGIVHRDLKPENIFLVVDSEVAGGERAKILDFGIAKVADAKGLTHTQAVMGTPAYMSPEQCRGAGHVDARSDIYSLGCVLYAILTGRPPFWGEGSGDFIVQHMTAQPPPLSSLRSVPEGVDELAARCLAKDPAHRFPTGKELAIAIENLLGRIQTGMGMPTPLPFAKQSTPITQEPTVAAAPSTNPAPVAAPQVQTTLSGSSGVSIAPAPTVAKKSNRGLAILGGLVVAGAAAGVIVVVTKDKSTPVATTTAPQPKDSIPEPTPLTDDQVLATFVDAGILTPDIVASSYDFMGIAFSPPLRAAAWAGAAGATADTSSTVDTKSVVAGSSKTVKQPEQTTGPVTQPKTDPVLAQQQADAEKAAAEKAERERQERLIAERAERNKKAAEEAQAKAAAEAKAKAEEEAAAKKKAEEAAAKKKCVPVNGIPCDR